MPLHGLKPDRVIIDTAGPDGELTKEEALAQVDYAELERREALRLAEANDDTSTPGNEPEPPAKNRAERRRQQAEERKRLKFLKKEAKRLGLTLSEIGVDNRI